MGIARKHQRLLVRRRYKAFCENWKKLAPKAPDGSYVNEQGERVVCPSLKQWQALCDQRVKELKEQLARDTQEAIKKDEEKFSQPGALDWEE